MANTVGSLLIKLRADIAEFKSDLGKANREVEVTAAQMKRNFRQQSREAKDSVDLLSDAVGVHLPRELKKVIAESQIVGPVLAKTFAIAGVASFAAILAESIIPKIKQMAEFMSGYTEEVKKAEQAQVALNKEIIASNDRIKQKTREARLEELDGLDRAKQRATDVKQDIEELKGQIADLERKRSEKLAQVGLTGLQSVNPRTGQRTLGLEFPNAQKEADELTTQIAKLQKQAQEAAIDAHRAGTGIKREFEDLGKAARKLADEDFQRTSQELSTLTERAQQLLAQGFDPMQRRIQELSAVIQDLTAKERELTDADVKHGIITAQRVAAEGQLADAIRVRADASVIAAQKELDAINQELSRLPRELPPLSGPTTKVTLERLANLKVAVRDFGFEMSSALKTALLNGGNFRDFLKVLIIDLIQMIAKLTIAKGLQDSMQGGGVGGFFSSLLGGFLGIGKRAAGGPVSAGRPYLVGEEGPEPFIPSVSGTIFPNSMLGRGGPQTVINYSINAGMSPQEEDRWVRVIKAVHKDAQNQAVRRVREDALRR